MSARLKLALEQGGLRLPETGLIRVYLATPDHDLSVLPIERVQVVQPHFPHFTHFRNAGFDCVASANGGCVAAIVFLPRAKALARALLQEASADCDGGLIVVDGGKSDGVDSMLRELRRRGPVDGPLAKAHGKIFWFHPQSGALSDWAAPHDQTAGGMQTAPGVFSADGIDPASRLLAEALPMGIGRHVVDLGAGWGYLSARILADPGVQSLDLVEADHVALDCARANLKDPRARFHWADALDWTPPGPVDAVVMNPPFHVSRIADPALGRGFIETAARLLPASGNLWMVANRHLPYEAALTGLFAELREIGGSGQFKLLHAARPLRRKRTRSRS